MAVPFLVLYLTKHLHISAPLAGLAVSAYGAGSFVVAPFAGKLSDRIGPFAIMRASLACTGLVLLVIPLLRDYTTILIATFVWGVVADASRPAIMAALTGSVPADKRQAAIAVNRLSINIGASIGPALGGFLALISFPLLFVVDALTTIAAAVVLTVLLIRHGHRMNFLESQIEEETSSKDVSGTGADTPWWRDARAIALVVAGFLVHFVYTQDIGALPLHIVNSLGYNERFYGSLFLLNTLLSSPSRFRSISEWPARRNGGRTRSAQCSSRPDTARCCSRTRLCRSR